MKHSLSICLAFLIIFSSTLGKAEIFNSVEADQLNKSIEYRKPLLKCEIFPEIVVHKTDQLTLWIRAKVDNSNTKDDAITLAKTIMIIPLHQFHTKGCRS